MTNDNDMSESLEQKLDDLKNANKIEFERVRDDIKKLGEGYEDGLREISQQLRDLDARWADKWTPHDMALKDHGTFVSNLRAFALFHAQPIFGRTQSPMTMLPSSSRRPNGSN